MSMSLPKLQMTGCHYELVQQYVYTRHVEFGLIKIYWSLVAKGY